MSDSEFLRRIAAPTNPRTIPEQTLWTMRKDSRCADARVRLTPIGMDLRFFLYTGDPSNARLLWSRIFRPQDGGTAALYDEQLLRRREFEVRGWAIEHKDVAARPTS